MGVAMDPDADGHYTTGSTEVMNKDNNDADSQEQSVKITMNLDWDQFNVGKDTGNANILSRAEPLETLHKNDANMNRHRNIRKGVPVPVFAVLI